MFDIGFSELLVCLVVALVVLGPEKLPKLARSIGRWTGRAKGYMRNLSDELDRESQLSELRRELDSARRAMQEGAQSFRDGVRSETDQLQHGIHGSIDPHAELKISEPPPFEAAPPAEPTPKPSGPESGNKP